VAGRQVADALIASLTVAEANFDAVVITFADGRVRNVFLAQVAAQGVHGLLLQLAQRGIHIHFHQEVHAAAQVKPQLHGFSAEHSQPLRGRGSQVERNDELVAQLAEQRFTSAELYVRVGETSQYRAVFERNRLAGKILFF